MKAKTSAFTIEESAIVERVARIVSTVRGTKPDYQRLAMELEQAIPFDVFGVVLLRHDREAVRVVVCRHEAEAWKVDYHQHPRKDSMLEHVLRNPILHIQDYAEGLDGPPAVSGDALSSFHHLHSTLIAPLIVEDHILGTLELGSSIPETYADETLQRLIQAVVHVLASAIESSQRGGSAAIQDRQRKALKDVASALTAKMELPTILDQIVVGISKALNVASAIILLNKNKLRLEALSGLDRQRFEDLLAKIEVADKGCIFCRTLLGHQSYVSHDIADDERFPESIALYSELGLHSVCCYPLVTGSTIYGTLMLGSPEPGGFTPLKAEILALFADQATIAIHNGILLEAAQQRRRFQDAIERLERAHRRNSGALRQGDEELDLGAEQLREELALLVHIREEAQRTFGVSFSSLLHFIGEHLLTQSERDLQAVLTTNAQEHVGSPAVWLEQKDTHSTTMSKLTRSAETALVRADLIGELGRLIMQLKQSTNGIRDAWCVVDLQGSCIYMNPAAELLCTMRLETPLLAYDTPFSFPSQRSVTMEQVFARLFPRIRNGNEVRAYLQELSQGSIYRQELRCIVAAEAVHMSTPKVRTAGLPQAEQLECASSDNHYLFTRYPLYNQQGQLMANALQVRDVTEQVRDEKNRSVLLSAVSHDLRTPLTTIKAAVSGLLQIDVAWDEQDRRDMLEDIDSETDHLTVLINALVELSRIEMGALTLDKEWCDLVEIVHGTLIKLERVLGSCVVRLQMQSEPMLVYVDHVQMERVFFNLLESAARRSPERAEILVIVDVLDKVLGAKTLRVCIIDRGEVVPEEERERVFTSLHSLRSYSNGMGLAICKGIIEAHQGRIAIDSAEGGGNCFVFTLPAHPSSATIGGGELMNSVGWKESGPGDVEDREKERLRWPLDGGEGV